MNIDTAISFVEEHPGNLVLSDSKTYILSASKTAIRNFGFDSIEKIQNVSYHNIPIKASKLAKSFEKSDKEITLRGSYIKVLGYWILSNDTLSLALGEKFPIKDNDGKVVAILTHNIDITQHNLVDIAKYLKLAEQNKSLVDNYGQFFYKLSQDKQHEQYNLSTREIECLFYLLRGKTAKIIGNILNLSYRTIESYIENIKYKFNCSSKVELIEKAIMEDYMTILPQSVLSRIVSLA